MISDSVRQDVFLTVFRNLQEKKFFYHCYLFTNNWQDSILSLDSAEDLNRIAQIYLTWPEVLTQEIVLSLIEQKVKTGKSSPRWDHRWTEASSEDIWLFLSLSLEENYLFFQSSAYKLMSQHHFTSKLNKKCELLPYFAIFFMFITPL